MKIIILFAGIIITGFIMVVFTPFFRTSGASFNATYGIGNFYGMQQISMAWPLIMWSIPVAVLVAVAFFWAREKFKR